MRTVVAHKKSNGRCGENSAPAVVLTLPFSITMVYLNASSEGLGPGQEKRPAKLVITG